MIFSLEMIILRLYCKQFVLFQDRTLAINVYKKSTSIRIYIYYLLVLRGDSIYTLSRRNTSYGTQKVSRSSRTALSVFQKFKSRTRVKVSGKRINFPNISRGVYSRKPSSDRRRRRTNCGSSGLTIPLARPCDCAPARRDTSPRVCTRLSGVPFALSPPPLSHPRASPAAV